MNKSEMLTALLSALALTAGAALADQEMEKCQVVSKDGKGLIKAHKSDCAGGGSSCAGSNPEGDPKAWILVPKGQCSKINAGDFSGVSQDIRDKIEGAS
jgi:uncharacterized membrane protein